MATKIRLQRQGRKRAAIYHIVASDPRNKRDGKYIERLGIYNPNTHPATVELDFEAAVKWIGVGAEMTDTARSILSKEGVLLMNHLKGGVRKGALTEEQAEAKFEAWKKENGAKGDAIVKTLAETKVADQKKAFAAETKIKEDRAAALAVAASELAASLAPVVEEVVAEEAPAAEEVVAEEAPATEEVVAEVAPATEEAATEEEEKTAE